MVDFLFFTISRSSDGCGSWSLDVNRFNIYPNNHNDVKITKRCPSSV